MWLRVPCTGLSDDDAREFLGKFLRTEELSPHVDTIVKYCRGSPMAIALIGALLKRNNTEARWREVAQRLEKGFLLHAKTKSTEANFSTLEESIKMRYINHSVHDLSPTLIHCHMILFTCTVLSRCLVICDHILRYS